jgi:hypothetical protein
VSSTPYIQAVVGLIASIVAILSVVLGLVVRATIAYTRLRMEVHSAIEDLDKHITDERGERIELRTMTWQRLDDMATTLSRVDRDVARWSGRRRDAGTT